MSRVLGRYLQTFGVLEKFRQESILVQCTRTLGDGLPRWSAIPILDLTHILHRCATHTLSFQ